MRARRKTGTSIPSTIKKPDWLPQEVWDAENASVDAYVDELFADFAEHVKEYEAAHPDEEEKSAKLAK